VPDPGVQEQLLQLDDVILEVEAFDVDSGAYVKIQCEGEPIRFPHADSFAEYIRDAIETELLLAGKYEQGVPVVLSGTVKQLEFKIDGRLASGAIGGTWIIDIELRSSNGQSLRAKSGIAYRTGFEVVSCPEAARAFMPAVQKLIRTAVTQQQFRSLTRMNSAG
jgi:hypothetical protein